MEMRGGAYDEGDDQTRLGQGDHCYVDVGEGKKECAEGALGFTRRSPFVSAIRTCVMWLCLWKKGRGERQVQHEDRRSTYNSTEFAGIHSSTRHRLHERRPYDLIYCTGTKIVWTDG
ncbi:hypothetical protein BDA96_01G429800 [Sorghum bicolor]|uniref:Uncharacterized protein n=1 Tax=Sorghum bicolor TaxID=4558 RepID=A0A921S403_SORBI|nr:hypothetical protein BDA96_01G429800 [Sorghum bicolor]